MSPGHVPVKNWSSSCLFLVLSAPLSPCSWVCVCVSPSPQREDGAAVDSRRHLQDLLLRDEPKPHPVLDLWFHADPDWRGHPCAGPTLQPGLQAQTWLIVDSTKGTWTGFTDIRKKQTNHQEPVTQHLNNCYQISSAFKVFWARAASFCSQFFLF